MARRIPDRANAEARRRREARQRRGDQSQSGPASPSLPESPTEPQTELWAASRSGARAGRGFRYQDLIATVVALRLWGEGEATALVTPEGYDDISVQSASGSSFIQVKSRREGAGDFPASQLRKDLRSVAKAWAKRRDAGLSTETTLLLERPVAQVPIPDWVIGAALTEFVAGPELTSELLAVSLEGSQIAAEFAASFSAVLCRDPHAQAIETVVRARDVPEALAEIIVAAVCTQVGRASDANADRDAADCAALDIASIDVLVDQILATVDVELLDEARSLGVCEAIDWGRSADDSDVRQGAHVDPSHIAGGLLLPRPDLVQQVIEVAEARRLAVIAGPSGSGKSALAYASVHEVRRLYRWQQVYSLTGMGRSGRDAVALILARIESLRPSAYAPVGILIDDAGRHDPDLLDRLLRRLADLPHVVTLISIREEDRFPVPLLSTVATITPMLDDAFAEQLWNDYHARGLTSWKGWREPSERADGLLLEYVSLLTEGESLDAVVGAQVQAREIDQARHLELEILRLASCANQYGVSVPAYAIQLAVDADLNAFTAASRRLIDEHLVVEDSSGFLRPLHEFRSAVLARASHPFGQRETLRHLVELVPSAELARFLRRALESGADPAVMIQAATDRVATDHALGTLIAVVSAFRADGLRRRADDWKCILDECGVDAGNAVTAFMMSRVHPRPDNDHLFRPEIAAAVTQLRSVATDPDLQPLWQAIDATLVEELLTIAIAEDATPLILQAITVLRGFDPATLETVVDAIGARLPIWPLRDSVDVMEALHRAAPALAARAVAAAGGEQLLLRRIVTETPWLASLERADDGVDGRWVFIDEELQPDQNGAVVDVCRLALALAPTATIARVSAVDALGRMVKLGDHPLVNKAIPRENLPNALEVSDNRAQARALSRKYGGGTLTSKLAAESEVLGALIDLLPEIATAHLGGRAVPQSVVRRFNTMTALLSEMDAPAEEGYTDEVPGALGDYPMESGAVTVVRSLLQHVIPNLARAAVGERRPIRTVGMLDTLIPKVGALIELDRYRFLPDPPDCARLLDCLLHLRSVASASACADASTRASMRAAAGRHTGTARIAAAAAIATERSSVALQKEALRMRSALADSGFTVAVVPSASDQAMMSWPPGDLAITVEGESLTAHLNAISNLADAARNAREQPDRRIWIGLHAPEGYVPASIFHVAHQGVLPLGNREAPSVFADSIAATPISGLYGIFLNQARRLSSIAAIIAIRGSTLIPDEEGRVLGESWERLISVKAQIDELVSVHTGTEYVSTLSTILMTVGAAITDDLSTAKDVAEEGRSGWAEVTNLQSLSMLDADQAGKEGTDAAVVYGTAVVISAIEDDFEGADNRIADMQEHPSNP